MTRPCTSFLELEGDCEGQLRDYMVSRKDGEPVRMEKLINLGTGEPLTVGHGFIQLCDKHYLYLTSARPELAFTHVDDPIQAMFSQVLMEDEAQS